MKKQQLEIALQKLAPLPVQSARLEQYATPAHVAADMLWEAFTAGDVEGKSVVDLGCGNGVFAIGAKLLGAKEALGVDVDPEAVKVAMENSQTLQLIVDFQEGDVTEISGKFDTVLQNPPFGAQTKNADRAFIKKAIELAPRTYSLHNEGTEEFVQQMVSSLGARAVLVKKYKFEIPYAFEFHTKPVETISVVLLRFEK
jgi:putative methylase